MFKATFILALLVISANTFENSSAMSLIVGADPVPATHYGDPNTNVCKSDEIAAGIVGCYGTGCFPSAGSACPTDVPKGTTATPQKVIHDGKHDYCGLVCDDTHLCAAPATCQIAADGTKLCLYNY